MSGNETYYGNIAVYSPLWGNTNYEELCKLEGFRVWRELGIQYIAQLYTDNLSKTFQELQIKYFLQSNTFFQYLQLRHALQTQFKDNKIKIQNTPLIDSLARTQVKRGLTSTI